MTSGCCACPVLCCNVAHRKIKKFVIADLQGMHVLVRVWHALGPKAICDVQLTYSCCQTEAWTVVGDRSHTWSAYVHVCMAQVISLHTFPPTSSHIHHNYPQPHQ